MKQWFLIQNKVDYREATKRYEAILEPRHGSVAHKEKLLLALLINHYEQRQWSIPDADPIEMIKIRMKSFGYKPADLAREYGDKGTVSKVLNYKQPLSLSMIRLFSKILRISVEALIKEYPLR